MKKSLRILSSLCIAAVMGSFTVGCSSKGISENQNNSTDKNGKVHLKMYIQYSDEAEKVPVDYAVEEMKKVMPQVDVEIMPEARDDNQKLKTYAAAGNLPDIFNANLDIVKTFKNSNNILQLDSYVKDLKIEDQLLDPVKKQLRDDDGHVYGMPTDASWYAMLFYNKEVFQKNGVTPPTNFDELVASIKTFKEKGIIPVAFFAKEKWPGAQLYDMIASRMNPKGISDLDKGTALASDDAFAKTANKINTLVNAGMLAPGAFNTGYDEALSMFAEGKAAMMLNGGWAVQDLGEKMPGKAGILKYPFADAGDEESVMYHMSGGAAAGGLAVSPFSKNKDIAAKYTIQFALKVSEGRVLKRGAFPMVKNSPQPESPYTDIQKEYQDFASKAETSTTFSSGMTNAKIKTALEDNVQKLLTGSYPVQNFIDDMNRTIKEARK